MFEGFRISSWKSWSDSLRRKLCKSTTTASLWYKKSDISLIRGQTENNNIAGTLSYLSFQFGSIQDFYRNHKILWRKNQFSSFIFIIKLPHEMLSSWKVKQTCLQKQLPLIIFFGLGRGKNLSPYIGFSSAWAGENLSYYPILFWVWVSPPP